MTVHAKAARLEAHDKPLHVEDVELSDPVEGEVVVDLLFAGVNPVDRYNAIGRINADVPLPRTLGMEAVGIAGDRVVLVHGHRLGSRRDGVWSEKVVVPESALVEVPDGLQLEQVAAVGVAGVTAWRAVTEVADVGATDRVLVLGAGGGVGSIAVSVAHAAGATVWGHSGTKDKEPWILALGADHVVLGDAGDLQQALGADQPTVVIDPLGGAFTGAAIEQMDSHGRLVIFGTSAGASGTVPLQSMYRKGIAVLGYAGLLTPDDVMTRSIEEALRAMVDGALRITVDSVVGLDQCNQALDRLGDRSVRGKVILSLSS